LSFDQLLHPAKPVEDLAALEAEILDEGAWTLRAVRQPAALPVDQGIDALRARVRGEGWARLPRALDDEQVALLLEAVRGVRQRGLPAVFAFLYPEVWSALASPLLEARAKALLGDGVRQLPRAWITIVRPVEGARGWEPHLDAARPARVMPDGRDERLTIWLPLTDATVDNGCMHIVPASRVGALPVDMFEQETVSSARALEVLHAVQAVECRAGDALCWRTDVIHFGGWATGESTTPRMALAVHLIHGDASVPVRERPTRDLFGPPPTHAERVAFVAKQLLLYAEYPEQTAALAPLLPLARRLRS
jgi:hypothetical protein